MAFDDHKNFAYSTVLTAPSPANSGTSLVVQGGDGAKFPTPPFNATVWPAGQQPTSTNAEIVRVTSIGTDTFGITRGTESSNTRSILVGDQICNSITDKVITDVETATTDNPYKFNVYRNAAFTDGNGAFAKVSFDTEVFDSNNNFSGGTYTVPISGFYWFSAAVNKSVTAANFSIIAIYKNGSEILRGMQHVVSATNFDQCHVSGILQLAANDTIEVYSYGLGGAGVPGVIHTYFHGFLVSVT